jgi:hypothetical protein
MDDTQTSNPLLNRLINPKKPFVRAGYCDYQEASLWGQIPLCGSLFLKIPPFKPEMFEKFFNIQIREIPKIVDFVKETGRLQITLSTDPVFYKDLDYLEPFFCDLNPIYEKSLPSSAFISEKEEMKFAAEYMELGKAGYFDLLIAMNADIGSDEAQNLAGLIRRIDGSVYAYLKILKYDSIIEQLQNLMVDNPAAAFMLFYVSNLFLIGPLTDPTCSAFVGTYDFFEKTNKNYALFSDNAQLLRSSEARYFHELQLEKLKFPAEIGKFIMHKLTYYPESLDACKELISHYNDTELIDVAESLNTGIIQANPDTILLSKKQLEQTMTELWNDKSIPNRITGLKYGIPVAVAAVGTTVLSVLAGTEGFLAGLGISVATRILDAGTKSFIERIAKFTAENYQANIYNFKKKYRLDT